MDGEMEGWRDGVIIYMDGEMERERWSEREMEKQRDGGMERWNDREMEGWRDRAIARSIYETAMERQNKGDREERQSNRETEQQRQSNREIESLEDAYTSLWDMQEILQKCSLMYQYY